MTADKPKPVMTFGPGIKYPPVQTDMKLHEGENWKVPSDPVWGLDENDMAAVICREDYATLRRVGWLDQKGRVWTAIPPPGEFDGGSLTPLLIDARDGD